MKTIVLKKCNICKGYGFWPIGDLSPLGEMDGKEWPRKDIVQCPECKAGGDNKSKRYKELNKIYKNYKNAQKK
jgi:hypothetical protein